MESTEESEREQLSSVWGPLAACSLLLLITGCLAGRYIQDGEPGGAAAAGFLMLVSLATAAWAVLTHRKAKPPNN